MKQQEKIRTPENIVTTIDMLVEQQMKILEGIKQILELLNRPERLGH